MDAEALGSAISIIGLILQAAGAALLVILFVLMRVNAGRRPYLRAWGFAWIMLTLALSTLVITFILDQRVIVRDDFGLGHHTAFMLYLMFKLLFMQQLFIGTLSYARHHPSRRVQLGSFTAVVVFSLAVALLVGNLNHIITMQAPFIIAGMGACAWLLFSLPPARRTLGSNLTGVLFATTAVLWIGYLFTFQEPVLDRFTAEGFGLLELLGRYNSFIDFMLQMLLAYGMVLILMEDAKREIDSAHAELAVAHRKLMTESLKDALTGAMNRRAYQLGTGLEHARASFGSVVVLDLDNLKEVNDTHGHAAGDEMLRHFADVLRPAMRPTDKLYRWGGDEFLLVMPRAKATAVGERIVQLLNSAPALELEDGTRLVVQASLGASDYRDGDDMEAAIHRADDQMYSIKRERKGAINSSA